jgi:hypothetical protein
MQTKKQFLNSMMNDPEMIRQFADLDRRSAVCEGAWNARNSTPRLSENMRLNDSNTMAGIVETYKGYDIVRSSDGDYSTSGTVGIYSTLQDIKAMIDVTPKTKKNASGDDEIFIELYKNKKIYQNTLSKQFFIIGKSGYYKTIESAKQFIDTLKNSMKNNINKGFDSYSTQYFTKTELLDDLKAYEKDIKDTKSFNTEEIAEMKDRVNEINLELKKRASLPGDKKNSIKNDNQDDAEKFIFDGWFTKGYSSKPTAVSALRLSGIDVDNIEAGLIWETVNLDMQGKRNASEDFHGIEIKDVGGKWMVKDKIYNTLDEAKAVVEKWLSTGKFNKNSSIDTEPVTNITSSEVEQIRHAHNEFLVKGTELEHTNYEKLLHSLADKYGMQIQDFWDKMCPAEIKMDISLKNSDNEASEEDKPKIIEKYRQYIKKGMSSSDALANTAKDFNVIWDVVTSLVEKKNSSDEDPIPGIVTDFKAGKTTKVKRICEGDDTLTNC